MIPGTQNPADLGTKVLSGAMIARFAPQVLGTAGAGV